MISRNRSWLGVLLLPLLVLSPRHDARAQGVAPSEAQSGFRLTTPRASLEDSFSGKWTYRSFVSDPAMSDPNAPLKTLLFGQGALEIAADSAGNASGTLSGNGWQLDLTGRCHAGDPPSIRFQGKGMIDGELWVYDYIGYAVPKWPDGIDQRPAIVGTIIRTVPHSNGSGGTSPAGYVAQWIAVRQDSSAATTTRTNGPGAGPGAAELIRQLETSWATAVETNDADQIAPFFGKDFVFVGPSGILQNREQHLDDFRTKKLTVDSMAIQSISTDVYDNVAVANVMASVKGAYDGRDITGDYSFKDTWRLTEGEWLAFARKQKKIEQRSLPMRDATLGEPVGPVLRQRYIDEQERENSQDRSRIRPPSGASVPSGSLQPETIRSINGRLDVTLEAKYETVQIGKDAVRLRTYNGKLVGPVLRAKAGDVLFITLINRLPTEPSERMANGHHNWNTTNLHFHGLHVAPQGPPNQPDAESDNVLLELMPSDPFDPNVSVQKYQVKIPANHVAGTFWYHAHKHGAVSAQVSSGMAGALIIERDDDAHNLNAVSEIAAAGEDVLVLQEIPYLKASTDPVGQIEFPPAGDPEPTLSNLFAPGAFRTLKRYITVNGEKIPTITMAPGEVRRLRFVYTGQRESARLRIERAPNTTGAGDDRLDMYEIAVDGLPTGTIRNISEVSPVERDRSLELYPGYRSDVLIQPPVNASGEYYLVDTRGDVNGVPRPDKGADGSDELVRWVARIVVSGSQQSMSLPTVSELQPHRLNDLAPSAATGTQYAFYGIDFAEDGGFFISRGDLSQTLDPVSPSNAKSYDPSDARELTLGDTEKWLVGSRNGMLQGQLADVTHPFHIHTNPFLVTKVTKFDVQGTQLLPLDVTQEEIGGPTWRDTLAMKQGYTYELLTRYDDFYGKFVDHCHILDHEDRGMMDLVEILNPSSPTALLDRDNSDASLPTVPGAPSVLLFVKGSFCPYCMSQVATMSERLAGRNVNVYVVSSASEDDLKAFPKTQFHLIADPELRFYKAYGVFNGETRHATIVLNAQGQEVFRNVDDEPMIDTLPVIQAVENSRILSAHSLN